MRGYDANDVNQGKQRCRRLGHRWNNEQRCSRCGVVVVTIQRVAITGKRAREAFDQRGSA